MFWDPLRYTVIRESIRGGPGRDGVGWCVGVITEANGDGRRKVDGEVVNFFAHYEIDGDTSKHVLTLAD